MIKTNISWSTHTHQFWKGCTKVGPGCLNCYMYRIEEDNQQDPRIVKRVSDKRFDDPIRWKKPCNIFVNSMSDFFHEQSDTWRAEAWAVIKACPQHNWLILTKRAERITECLPPDWVGNYQNVMLGVSIENQDYAYRMDILAEVPDAKRFISAEPLLGPLTLNYTNDKGIRPIDSIKWVIIGGESGYETGKYKYRECKLEWIQDLVKDLQTNAPHIKIHVKQLGSWLKKSLGLKGWHGSDVSEFPKELQLRSNPKVNTLSVH